MRTSLCCCLVILFLQSHWAIAVSAPPGPASGSPSLSERFILNPELHTVFAYGVELRGVIDVAFQNDTLLVNGRKPFALSPSFASQLGIPGQTGTPDSQARDSLSRPESGIPGSTSPYSLLEGALTHFDSLRAAGVEESVAAELAKYRLDPTKVDLSSVHVNDGGITAYSRDESAPILLVLQRVSRRHTATDSPISVASGQLSSEKASAWTRQIRAALDSNESALILISRAGIFMAVGDPRIPSMRASINETIEHARQGQLDLQRMKGGLVPYGSLVEIAEANAAEADANEQ